MSTLMEDKQIHIYIYIYTYIHTYTHTAMEGGGGGGGDKKKVHRKTSKGVKAKKVQQHII